MAVSSLLPPTPQTALRSGMPTPPTRAPSSESAARYTPLSGAAAAAARPTAVHAGRGSRLHQRGAAAAPHARAVLEGHPQQQQQSHADPRLRDGPAAVRLPASAAWAGSVGARNPAGPAAARSAHRQASGSATRASASASAGRELPACRSATPDVQRELNCMDENDEVAAREQLEMDERAAMARRSARGGVPAAHASAAAVAADVARRQRVTAGGGVAKFSGASSPGDSDDRLAPRSARGPHALRQRSPASPGGVMGGASPKAVRVSGRAVLHDRSNQSQSAQAQAQAAQHHAAARDSARRYDEYHRVSSAATPEYRAGSAAHARAAHHAVAHKTSAASSPAVSGRQSAASGSAHRRVPSASPTSSVPRASTATSRPRVPPVLPTGQPLLDAENLLFRVGMPHLELGDVLRGLPQMTRWTQMALQLLASLRLPASEVVPLGQGCLPPAVAPAGASAPLPTLVLDLDETLVHCVCTTAAGGAVTQTGAEPRGSPTRPGALAQAPNVAPHVVVTFEDGSRGNVYFRPLAQEFLAAASKWFEIVVFTASTQNYADQVIDRLDVGGFVAHRLYRHHCTRLENGSFGKDLGLLGRPMNSIVLVDNSPISLAICPDHGIPSLSWSGDQQCTELQELIELLMSLRCELDFGAALARRYGFGQLRKQLAEWQRKMHAQRVGA